VVTHLVSEADHRLNHVEPWAAQPLQTLRGCTGQPIHPLALSDDRLAAVLEALSDPVRWPAFEEAFTQPVLRVYDRQPERGRLDATTASEYRRVTEDGLFQFGPSQDHRPDLAQLKIMLSVLAPLGLPVATAIVPGQRADDPLYLPALTRVREIVGRRRLLYVGDCEMGALETRAALHAGGDFYWCPLSERQVPPVVVATYLAPVWTGDQPLILILRERATEPEEVQASGFERLAPLTAVVAGVPLGWTERRRLVRSRQLAQAQAAVAALNARGRGNPRFAELPALQAAADTILTRERVQGVLQVRSRPQERWRSVRGSGDRPARLRVEQG
jgi:hypothetical protein